MVKRKKSTVREKDSTYFLKIVLYMIIGTQWLWLVDANVSRQIPVPYGFLAGMLLAWHDHFQIDRKIEYAVLLVAMLVGFWSNAGIYLNVL